MIPVSLSLITGIMAGNFLPDLPMGILILSSLVPLFAIKFFLPYFKPLILGLCILAISWGFFSISKILNPDQSLNSISRFTDSSAYTITGQIISFSKDDALKKRVVLACTHLEKKGMKPVKVNGNILLNIYFNRSNKKEITFGYGDIVRFEASLKPIRNFSNPNGFDYEKRMKLAGVFGSAYGKAANIHVIPHPIGGHIKIIRTLEQIRNQFFYFAMGKMENKEAMAILVAMVTGKKEGVSFRLKDLFSKAGASHLLAISGLHLSIVAIGFFMLFYWLFAWFPLLLMGGMAKKAAGILTLIPLLFYSILSGFSPSTQRALIMTTVFMVSFMGEQENNPINTLSFAAVIILIMDCTALFSISFQLSFGALGFIVMGFSMLRIRGWTLTKNLMGIIISAALVSFFAGCGTFPLIAHYFNLISYVQILANLILIPLVGFICLPLGFLGFAFFLVWPALAQFFLTLSQGILVFCISYIEFLTGFKASWSRITCFDTLGVAVAYLVFTAVALILFHRKKSGIIFMVIALGCLSFTVGLKTKSFQNKMVITILDVGQGSSALIQTIEGKNILVDGGGFSERSSFDTGRYLVAPFLWSKKISNLDAIVLTHPESDHMNGLVYILENFKVNLLVKNTDTRASGSYRNLMDLCRKHQIKIWHPSRGDAMLDFGQTFFTFLQGFSGDFRKNRNNNSLVFKVRLNEFTILFPGDILKERERQIAGQRRVGINLNSTLLISPHHGSISSSSKIFLDKVNPESVVISCGYGNRYGFPHPSVLKRYKNRGFKVFRTDMMGAVTISSDGIDYNILTHKGG
jgi:competence protein ComEC